MQKEKKQLNSVVFFIIFIAVIVLIAIIANIFTEVFFDKTFLSADNIRIIISNSIYPTFIAWAMCFLFACGYVDLSLGAVVILGAFMTCWAGNLFGYVGVILGGLITGTLLVFINFMVFAFTKIPSWIAGICLAMIYEAISVYLITNKATKDYFNTSLDKSYRVLGEFPVNVIILVVGFVVVYFIYNRTAVGINVRAIGGNKAVSKELGINVVKTLVYVGLICGILIGVAAILQESYNGKTTTISGMNSIQTIFKPLAIALLAQVMEKKLNIIIAVPFCSILIYGIFNLMTFLGVPSGTLQDVCLCAFLIIFGAIGQRGVKGVVK